MCVCVRVCVCVCGGGGVRMYILVGIVMLTGIP